MKTRDRIKAKLLLLLCMIIALALIKIDSARMYDKYKIESDHSIQMPLNDTITALRTDINR